MIKKLLLLLSILNVNSGNSVEICHFPPGNPDNWHTINVSNDTAIKHFEQHGDFDGPCTEFCERLCNDTNHCNDTHCLKDNIVSQIEPNFILSSGLILFSMLKG